MALAITGTGNGSLNNLALSGNTGTIVDTARAGGVLQVVQNTYATQVRTGSNTLIDTGLNATITPTSSSNKILVFVQQSGCYKDSTSTKGTVRLYRGTTFLQMIDNNFAFNQGNLANSIGSINGVYLDSPATTSAITYKTQFSSVSNSVWVYIQVASETSTMTLMEIVA